MARRLGLGIGISKERVMDPSRLVVHTITWLGTSDPTILVQELNFNELTITWAGTSSPNLNVT